MVDGSTLSILDEISSVNSLILHLILIECFCTITKNFSISLSVSLHYRLRQFLQTLRKDGLIFFSDSEDDTYIVGRKRR